MEKNFWLQLKKPVLALAPMEGVTDSSFRQICKHWGADVVYTEFISADAIDHDARRAFDKMVFDPVEQPVVCQIFGRDPEAFKRAAQEVQSRGFAGLDINFGCPARKVVGHGSGAALLRRPEFARQLIEIALTAVTIPVSIKVRSSIRANPQSTHKEDDARYTAVDLLKAITDLPIAAIMIHGRSFEQGHTGQVDVEMIKVVKQLFNGPVLANGGIYTPERAQEMLQLTGADGLGIARGAWGQPWLFRQIHQLLDTGQYQAVQAADIMTTIRNQAELSNRLKGERGLIELRKHLVKHFNGWPAAARWRRLAGQVRTLEDITELLKNCPTRSDHRAAAIT